MIYIHSRVLEASLAGKESVEQIKRASQGLRGDIATELKAPVSGFAAETVQILKFHGIYQQDDRDQRRALREAGSAKSYSMMIRVPVPGGELSREQYLALDQLADTLGGGKFRLTTRQAVQFHGVVKGDLKPLMQELDQVWLPTISGCGDVVRNIMSPPGPFTAEVADLSQWARELAQVLRPETQAYYEIWLDQERAVSLEAEPIYGATYLPRKFKIAFCLAGDNSVDIYSQDVGIVGIPKGGRIERFVILVGGGLGITHGVKDTRPFLAQPLATVAPGELTPVVSEIIKIQRDYGNREDRKHARMKYLIAAWGLPKFKEELEARLGHKLAEPEPLLWQGASDFLGWQPDGDLLANGVYIPAGRVQGQLKGALLEAIEYAQGAVVTPQQNLVLRGIEPEEQTRVAEILAQKVDSISPLRRRALACPALPTCGLALAEAERVLPELLERLEQCLADLELVNLPLELRLTGCPNNCARPFTAEIGVVGRSLGSYNLYLGGSPKGDRLARLYAENVPFAEVPEQIRALLLAYRSGCQPDEAVGDFFCRTGLGQPWPEPVVSTRL